jgi:hypothetical protein
MGYKAGTLLGNWFEQRLEPANSESFSGLMLPTAFAQSYKTSYAEMTKAVAAAAPPAKFRPPSEDWLSGGTDPLTPQQRYKSVNTSAFRDPAEVARTQRRVQSKHPMQGSVLEEYRKLWTNN